MSGGKLPEGWSTSTISEICNLNPKLKLDDDLDVGFMPMAGVPTTYLGKCNFETKKWSEVKKGFTQFQNGDVIFAKITPCFENGKAFVIKEFPNGYGAGSTEYYVLRSIHGLINPHWLFALVKTKDFLTNGALNMSGSVGHKRVTKEFVENYGVPVPPLAEQKIIAKKLDTLLAQVDSTKARLEQIPQILKRFRQAVLSAAVSGRLTKVWREKNQDSSSSGEWQQFALSELGDLSRGKSKHRPRNDPRLFGDTYPFIQTGEVANSSGRIKSATKFYSEFGLSQSKLFPQGTLCITIAANIADTAILDIDACFPDSVVGFIPKKNKSHVLFIKYLIDANKEDLEAYAPATAQKNINLKVLNDLRFPMPGIEEQHEIVRRVEQLFAYADTIEKQVNNALTRVNSLTQSILAKALRGELTAQWRAENPDLISGENSAAALLEKIKAERAASGGKKASRKKA